MTTGYSGKHATYDLGLRPKAVEPPKDREQIAVAEFEGALQDMDRAARRMIDDIVALRDAREHRNAKSKA